MNLKVILLFAMCCFLLLSEVSNTNTENKNRNRNRSKQDFKIRPNLSDLNQHFQKSVKPYIDHPFIPTEVESLGEKKKVNYANISMSNALLVGKKDYGGRKEIERPIMYSTIVMNHPTVIRHATPQPSALGVHPEAAKAFALTDEATALAKKEEERQKKGKYSVPVKIESSQSREDDTLEVPNFIQSKETVLNEKKNNKFKFSIKEQEPQKFIQDSFHKDADMLLHNLENKRDKAERISVLIKGKKKIHKDMNDIRDIIHGEIKELLFAKEVALKLTNLNNYYTTQIKRTKLSGLKLSEVISVKKLLMDKILKEIQGFRTASADFAELDKVNRRDVEMIMKNIKYELNK